MIRAFLKSESGNFSAMLIGVLPLIFAGVGISIDVATMSTARSKLQHTLDAAVLAASRIRDASTSRQDVFDAFLAANLGGEPTIENYKGALTVSDGLNRITTNGELAADVKLRFMHHLGRAPRITVKAGAYEATDTLEVVMVLDNTGSMGSARMQSLRDAATDLVEILEGAKTPSRQVKAALVPFVTAVNVKGDGFSDAWIDRDAKSPHHGAHFEKHGSVPYNHLDLYTALGVTWKGCVEARPAPYNLSDAAPDPADGSTLFVPYFAPDNPGAAAKSPNDGAKWNNSYLGDTNYGTPAVSSSETGQRSILRYLNPLTPRHIDEKGPRTTGPNYACPTPIVPLTSDFAKLKSNIGKMIYWEGSGTNVSEGLAWGMRVLSPGEPYTQGAPFEDESVTKVVVVFTDGENTVFGASNSGLTSSDRLPFNKSDYGSYGFLDSGRMGTTSRSTALTNVNGWTQSMCTTLKNKRVRIFTVLLGADTAANRTLYSTCASSPADYFPTDDVSKLTEVFNKIGTAVAQLYLTQ